MFVLTFKLYKLIGLHNFVLMNEGSGTRIGLNRIISPLHLTFFSPGTASKFTFKVILNKCNSGYFPFETSFQVNHKLPPAIVSRYSVFNKANNT